MEHSHRRRSISFALHHPGDRAGPREGLFERAVVEAPVRELAQVKRRSNNERREETSRP